MITSTRDLPPAIRQSFSRKLLSTPTFKWGEDSERLLEQFEYIKKLFYRQTKSGYHKANKIKGEKIIKELEELYEWVKTKEKELKGTTSNKTKQLFYYVGCVSEEDRAIYKRFEFRRKALPISCGIRTY